MSNETMALAQAEKRAPKVSALVVMASRFNVEPEKLLATLKETAFKGATDAQMMALTIVANEFGLNPFTKEIYAFPDKGGGIVPVIGIDGWLRRINEHPSFDGMEHAWHEEGGKVVSCTCTIYRKDRGRAISVTEFMEECRRNTDPWNKSPRRMLRHRATIQCARVAFGFGGGDEDEASERVVQGRVVPVAEVPLLLGGAPAAMEERPEEPKVTSASVAAGLGTPGRTRRGSKAGVVPEHGPERLPAADDAPLDEAPSEPRDVFWRKVDAAGMDKVAVMDVLRRNMLTEAEWPADLSNAEASQILEPKIWEKLVELGRREAA